MPSYWVHKYTGEFLPTVIGLRETTHGPECLVDVGNSRSWVDAWTILNHAPEHLFEGNLYSELIRSLARYEGVL